MSKFVKIWLSAQVNGRLRHPSEGVLHLENEEADRLIREGSGEDVTEDFTAEQLKTTPVESVTVRSGAPASPAAFDPAAEEGRIIADRRAAAAPAPALDPLDHDGNGRKGGSKPKG
jgi:hypothetical protein